MVTSPAAASAWVSPAPFVPAAAVVSAGFVPKGDQLCNREGADRGKCDS